MFKILKSVLPFLLLFAQLMALTCSASVEWVDRVHVRQTINQSVLAPDGRYYGLHSMYYGRAGGSLSIFDAFKKSDATFDKAFEIPDSMSWLYSISSGARYAVVGTDNHTQVWLLDLNTGESLHGESGNSSSGVAMHVSNDNKTLIVTNYGAGLTSTYELNESNEPVLQSRLKLQPDGSFDDVEMAYYYESNLNRIVALPHAGASLDSQLTTPRQYIILDRKPREIGKFKVQLDGAFALSSGPITRADIASFRLSEGAQEVAEDKIIENITIARNIQQPSYGYGSAVSAQGNYVMVSWRYIDEKNRKLSSYVDLFNLSNSKYTGKRIYQSSEIGKGKPDNSIELVTTDRHDRWLAVITKNDISIYDINQSVPMLLAHKDISQFRITEERWVKAFSLGLNVPLQAAFDSKDRLAIGVGRHLLLTWEWSSSEAK